MLLELVIKMLRGPAIALALIYALHPTYLKCASRFRELWGEERFDIGWEHAWFVFALIFVHETIYYSMNFSFLAFDRFGIFEEYKLPRSPRQVPSAELVRKTLWASFVGHWLVQPFTAFSVWYVIKWAGMPSVIAPLPSCASMYKHLVCAWLFNDFFFYWSHRALHTKALYKYHKQHHEYNGTIGFAAEYAGVIETIFSNQFPTLGYCLLSGVSFPVTLMWVAWRLEQTYEGHSGYSFLDTPLGRIGLLNGLSAEYHDYHHSRNMGNFGGGFWDHVCATNTEWLKHLEKQKKAGKFVVVKGSAEEQ